MTEIRNRLLKSVPGGIFKILDSKNITQRELADSLGVCENTVSKYVSGKALPSVEVFALLIEKYGVTFEEIIRGGVSK